MDVVTIVLAFIAGFSTVLAGWFYYQLWKWAQDCQQATVVVGYKRKVVMSPTLVELLLWSRKVPKDQTGQAFYKARDVTIAITRRDARSWWQRRRIRKNIQPPQAQSRFGTWSIKQDEEQQAS